MIRRMKEIEIQTALDWAQKEGWNPGVNDADCLYQADPNGFFVGILDNEPIAVGSAIVYDDKFAFCGLYIVKKEFRKQGYGLKLTQERLKYIGNRITGIDGAPENVPIFERLGYVSSHRHVRYEWNGNASFPSSDSIIDLKTLPFTQLEEFDCNYFPANRSNFLRAWINQPNSFAIGHLNDQQLGGYGVIRKCFQGWKIGPLYAKSPLIAHGLFEALCAKVKSGPVCLDIPEPNKNAQLLVKHFMMVPKLDAMRMYRNGIPKINHEEGIYGITTFELG